MGLMEKYEAAQMQQDVTVVDVEAPFAYITYMETAIQLNSKRKANCYN
jgi:hypothetical protein